MTSSKSNESINFEVRQRVGYLRALVGTATCLASLIMLSQESLAQKYELLTTPIAKPTTQTTSPAARSVQVRSVGAAAVTPFPLADTFKLHSRPQAALKIYLDFDGHVTQNTAWNTSLNAAKIWTIAYSLDNDPSTFNDAERTEIQGMWQRVAEAYSPFHVDVTTEAPSVADLVNTGAGDTKWGMRVLVGTSTPSPYAGSGGVAFRPSFGSTFLGSPMPGNPTDDTPCFAGADAQGNDSFVLYLTCVHEAGHTLGLRHDGNAPDATFLTYYAGHGGTGPTSWAPFMGAGFTRQLQQWSKGEYVRANNFEDDLSIITTQNGFSYRADDAGNSAVTARTIAGATSGSVFTIKQAGVIERNTDTDWFKINAKSGIITVNAVGAALSPMLDIQLDLYDANGVLLVSDNPIDELGASITKTVVAGTYYVKIDGVGMGDFSTGYSDYGSLGQYTLTGSFSAGTSAQPASVVTASYNAGTKTLTVVGDSVANSVSIVRDGLNLKVEGGGATKVKVGAASATTSYVFTLAAGTTAISLDVDLKEGNDILSIDRVQMQNGKFELGAGADNLAIKSSPGAIVTINGDTSAANVAGADTVLVQSSNISTSLTINLGPLNDSFSLSSSSINTLNLQMGSGNDSSTLSFSTLTNLTADGGAGTDTLVRTTSTVTNAPTILNVP